MKTLRGFTAVELVSAMVVFAGLGGWVANVVKLLAMVPGEVTAMFAIRVVGVFSAPMGAILGFM